MKSILSVVITVLILLSMGMIQELPCYKDGSGRIIFTVLSITTCLFVVLMALYEREIPKK